jgi:hypothetical protein
MFGESGIACGLRAKASSGLVIVAHVLFESEIQVEHLECKIQIEQLDQANFPVTREGQSDSQSARIVAIQGRGPAAP